MLSRGPHKRASQHRGVEKPVSWDPSLGHGQPVLAARARAKGLGSHCQGCEQSIQGSDEPSRQEGRARACGQLSCWTRRPALSQSVVLSKVWGCPLSCARAEYAWGLLSEDRGLNYEGKILSLEEQLPALPITRKEMAP